MGSIVSSRFLVALKATGTSALKVITILVALKATIDKNVNSHFDRTLVPLKTAVDRNVNSHCRQEFGSSEKLHCHLRQLMGSIGLPGF